MWYKLWHKMRRNLYLFGLLLGVALTLPLATGCSGAVVTATSPPVPTRTSQPAATPTTVIEPTAPPESAKPADTKVLESWSSLSPDGLWR